MGLILKKVTLEDYVGKQELYSKLIRNNLDFTIEVHNLEKGQKLQLFLYRNHPRVKEFIEANRIKNHLTVQHSIIKANCTEIKITLNNLPFMICGTTDSTIDITEYNFNGKLKDFAKGKVAILIEMTFTGETDNNKIINELRKIGNENKEETNETRSS